MEKEVQFDETAREDESGNSEETEDEESSGRSESTEWTDTPTETKASKMSESKSKAENGPGKKQMIKLEDQMNHDNLEMLQQIFEEADEDCGGGLDLDEFRQAMIKTMAGKGVPDDNQLAIIFMKVDANCDGTVDWEEFCSYMLLETQLKDVMTSEDREMEFPHPAREIPSLHRDTMTRITYLPKVSHGTDDPGADSNVGRYVSVSKEGIVHFWSMDLNPLKTLTLGNEGKASKSIWITDCVVLPNAKKFALSTADGEIAFYDCSANSFDKQFVICSLDHCVLTMDYWYSPAKINEGILLFGDTGGSVTCLKFTGVTGNLFDLTIGQHIPSMSFRRFSLAEIELGKHPNIKMVQFNSLHEDWVRKVKYYPSLQNFISCATATNTSMYLGDVDRKKTSSVFRIRKGITSFDYCKEWNVIVTGGFDHYVRLWNPYVTSKSTSVLKGHSSAVTHIIVNSDKGEIISAAADKVIKIWDMRDLCCVQTIPTRSLLPGPHLITSLYFNIKSHCIFVGTNQFSVIEGKNEEPSEEQDVVSHLNPICAAIYNDLFEQVVSACHDSVVCVWSLETGEKIIQFSNAHGNSEITAMKFDPSKRRLITGARDGTVHIWNFNNGCCLRQLQAVDDEEITGILYYKQKIVTVGWSRKVTIYKDCREEEEGPPRVWRNFHEDDILCAAMYPNGFVATSSYDGIVKVWNIETGHVHCNLNAKDYGLESTKSLIPPDVKKQVSLNNAVLDATKRFQEAIHDKKSPEAEAIKKQRKLASILSKWRVKGESAAVSRSSPSESSNDIKIGCLGLPEQEFAESYHDSSVDKVLVLEKRENNLSTATLVTTGSGGSVRAWSVAGGGLLGHFTAVQGDESIISMTTDGENTLLVTGDTTGFIKVWDISSYCITNERRVSSVQRKRLSVRLSSKAHSSPTIDTNPPPLLITFRAHLKPVVSLEFVDSHQFIISASTDNSVRLWTQTGRYIGTFGQRALWDLEKTVKGHGKLPPDIQRIASAETLKNLQNPSGPKWRLAKTILRITALTRRGTHHSIEDTDDTDISTEWESSIVGSLENVLGKFYRPKTRHRFLPSLPKLKFNQDQMVVYSSLNVNELQSIEEGKTPAVLLPHATRYKSSSALLPRAARVANHRANSDCKYASYNTAVKPNRTSNIVMTKSASRRPHDGLVRSTLKKTTHV